MFQGGGGGAIRRQATAHNIDLLAGKYFYKGQRLAAKYFLNPPFKFALKCTITLRYDHYSLS